MPPKRKHVRVANTETGEIQAWEVIEEQSIEPYWLSRARSTNFSIMNEEPGAMLAGATEALDNFSFRVLMFMAFEMGMKNELRMSQIEMADRLNVDAPRISKAISVLVTKKLITKGKRRGIFYVNPFFCWKGNDFDRARAMKFAASKHMDLSSPEWLAKAV